MRRIFVPYLLIARQDEKLLLATLITSTQSDFEDTLLYYRLHATTKPPTVDLKSTFPSLTGLNPLKEVSIPILFGRAITIVLRVLGSLDLIIFMYGGILWMTAAGNDEHVKKALSTIVWGAMGIFVIFASYAMVQFILDSFL